MSVTENAGYQLINEGTNHSKLQCGVRKYLITYLRSSHNSSVVRKRSVPARMLLKSGEIYSWTMKL